MSKPTVVVSCPIDTYSGYGGRARDFVHALIDLGKYDVKILAQKWGETRWGYLKDHGDTVLSPRIISTLNEQPDIWIQITIPNEFQKIGRYNIGVTAAMETTLCHPNWIKGANNMDLILVSSEHSKATLVNSKFDAKDEKTGQLKEQIELKTNVEVLFEGVKLDTYFPTKGEKPGNKLNLDLDNIPESFCFLSTGHWMQGDFGEDRKNIGFTIKSFLETFKNKKTPPALILKSHSVTTSIMDRERMLDKIDAVRKTVKGTLPNIYLVHGEVTDEEMNQLYNHPKVKAFVSLTKGEGFGRPFLEFSTVGKPIIASAWSGHTDFLSKEFVRYVKGTLTNPHKSAIVKDIILAESQWFTPDPIDVGKAFKDIYSNYKDWSINAKRQGRYSRENFSYEKMVEKLDSILTPRIPEFPKQINLNLPKIQLPKLQKTGPGAMQPTIQLPKLKKL